MRNSGGYDCSSEQGKTIFIRLRASSLKVVALNVNLDGEHTWLVRESLNPNDGSRENVNTIFIQRNRGIPGVYSD
jgi:hypothetical protein